MDKIGDKKMKIVVCIKQVPDTVEVKIDPKTGKTETVTVEVSPEEAAKPKAIADSSGIYKQKFILEKGTTYPLVSYQREIQSFTSPDGKTMNGTNETTDEMLLAKLCGLYRMYFLEGYIC